MDVPRTTVLVVDDDVHLLAAMAGVLTDAGFDVIAAPSGREGIRRSERANVDVLVSDVMMPAMNGCELATSIVQRHAGVRVLFVTGGPRSIHLEHPVLDKPFTPAALVEAVLAVLRAEL